MARFPETATGRWLKSRKDGHECCKPIGAEAVYASVGDQWKCDYCNRVWEVNGIDWPSPAFPDIEWVYKGSYDVT